MQDTEISKQQHYQAIANSFKDVTDLNVGDFVYVYGCGLKNQGRLASNLYFCSKEEPRIFLCKIEKITFCVEEELLSNTFIFGGGGSNSDVFDSEQEACNYYQGIEKYKYFYNLVTLVFTDKGRYAFFDAQGYDYPRYAYYWSNWRTMYATEIEQETQRRAEEERQQKKKDEQKRKKTQKTVRHDSTKILEFFRP